MILTEYSQKLILKYFISDVGEFQNKFLEFDFGFHAFGPHSDCGITPLPAKKCAPLTPPSPIPSP